MKSQENLLRNIQVSGPFLPISVFLSTSQMFGNSFYTAACFSMHIFYEWRADKYSRLLLIQSVGLYVSVLLAKSLHKSTVVFF